MPRDINGNFSLTVGNPVVSNTVIEANWANTTLEDIAAALTDSLSRSGSGNMLVPFRAIDGSEANPAYSFLNEPTSGLYYAGVNDLRLSVNGQDVMRWIPGEVQAWNPGSMVWQTIAPIANLAGLDADDALITDGNTQITLVQALSRRLPEFSSVNEAMSTDLSGFTTVRTLSFYFLANKGGGVYIADGTNGTASTIYPDNLGFYDANGDGFSLSINNEAGLNVFQVGATGDGATDDTVALQYAHSSGYNVYYPPGTYIITSPLQISAGANIIGSGGQITTQNIIHTSKIQNSVVGGGVFWYTGYTIGGGVDGPEIYGLVIEADYPIRFNDRELNSADGSTQPSILRPNIHDCEIKARTPYVGIGVDWVRCFDGVFCRNHITDFQYGMVLSSSDINSVYHNRFIDQGDAHIIVHSSGTFGSSNEIRHNDLLIVQAGGSFIISNDHHVRIYDNYLEQASADIPFAGIDIGTDNMPAIFGVNVSSICYTCVITDNRNDLFNFAGTVVYRIEPTMVSCKLYDVGTTGPVSGTNVGLQIKNDVLPVYYNVSHVLCNWDFRGEGLGYWNGFKSGEPLPAVDTLAFDVSSYASLNPQSSQQNAAGNHLRYDYDALVLLTTLTVVGYFYPPRVDGNNNVFLKNGNTYQVTVVAKTDSALGDDINMARNGAAFNLLSLTEQYEEYTFNATGQLITALTGVLYQRATFNGNIKIKSVRWKKI